MNILSVVTHLAHGGGIPRHVMDLSQALSQRGHKMVVVGTPPASQAEAVSLLDNSSIPFRIYPLAVDRVSGFDGIKSERTNVFVRVANAVREGLRLRKIIREEEIDLVHAHESAPGLVARIATLGTGIPVVMTYHGSEPERLREFAAIARVAARVLVTPSHMCAQNLHTVGHVPESKLKVIGLGVQAPPFIDEAEIAACRRRLLGDGNRLVVMVARITYQKGIDIFVRVVEKVAAENPDIRFAVVGDGGNIDEMKDLAERLDVSDKIIWVGLSKNPYLYLYAADLFLLTSRWEALPISIVEAFRAGLPVVATQTGGVSELVDPSVGCVVPVGDVAASAQAVLKICADDTLRAQMSQGAKSLAGQDRFCPDYIHDQFEVFYQDVINSA